MRDFTGLKFDKTRITLDDTQFANCEISNCEIIYSGGIFGWTNTNMTNCRLVFRGPAAMSVRLLEVFGLIDPSNPNWKAVVLEFPPSQTPPPTVQ